jgi:hypothetical protein
MNGDFDGVAMACERFIDGIIYDFVDQVMQTPLGRVADIHAWTFSNSLQPFQNFYVVGVVRGILRSFFVGHFHPEKL